MLNEVEQLLNRIKTKKSQFELDGVKNVWIVKPGAKSRGRGNYNVIFLKRLGSDLILSIPCIISRIDTTS